MSQEILWTVLPGGMSPDGRANINIHVSPRVSGGSLNDSAFRNWPEFLERSALEVRLNVVKDRDRPELVPLKLRLPSNLNPARNLWTLLFQEVLDMNIGEGEAHSRTFAQGRLPTFSSHPLILLADELNDDEGLYPTAVRSIGSNDYSGLVRRLDELKDVPPAVAALKGDKTEPGKSSNRLAGALDFIRTRGTENRAPAEGPVTWSGLLDAAAKRYKVTRRQLEFATLLDFHSPVIPDELPVKDKLDFHQMLAALGDYPWLLRALGLVLEFDPVALRCDGDLLLRLDRERLPAGIAHLTPATACTLDRQAGLFAPRWRGEPPRPAALTFDTDGAALKLLGMAQRPPAGNQQDDDSAGKLPAQRSDGISVALDGRAFQVEERLGRLPGLLAAADGTAQAALFADDLIRGYRVDVNGKSLCQRKGRYGFAGKGRLELPEAPVEEEGYIKAGTAVSYRADGSDPHLHEALFNWDGWSLCVRQCGKMVKHEVDENGRHSERPADPPDGPPAAAAGLLPMSAHFDVPPGSLPKLRFGKSYEIALRPVDVSGADIPLAGPLTTRVYFPRHEPVAPPALVPAREFLPGESVERLVVRSFWDEDQKKNVPEAGKNSVSLRYLFPPKTSQRMAEMHGKFDGWIGNANATEAELQEAYDLASREARSLRDLEGAESVSVGGQSDDGEATFIIVREGTHTTPYLPDPQALGVAFEWLERPPAQLSAAEHLLAGPRSGQVHPLGHDVTPLPFQQKLGSKTPWADLMALYVKLTALAAAGVKIARSGQVPAGLEVLLAPGKTARLRYSTLASWPNGKLDPGDIYNDFADPARHQGLMKQLVQWQWVKGENAKELADVTGCQLAAMTGTHWMVSPPRELVLVHAVQKPVQAPELTAAEARRSSAETAARLVRCVMNLERDSTGQVDVIAEWMEYDDSCPAGFNQQTATTEQAAIMMVPKDGPAPDKFTHQFKDTRRRDVTYRLRGISRYAEHFPGADVARDDGSAMQVTIPSSARPAAPRVLYIVPTFGWEGGRWNGDSFKSTRKGLGLRIYLDRPWWSSGAGEQLAVVLDESQAAADPVYAKTGVNKLTADHFADGDKTKRGLVLYDVKSDPANKRWFVDILFKPATVLTGNKVRRSSFSYSQFVRLALARHQSKSIAGMHRSDSVLADFAQLSHDRSLTVVRKGRQLDITLTASDFHQENVFDARLQKATGGTDLGWADVPNSAIVLAPSGSSAGQSGTGLVPQRPGGHAQTPGQTVPGGPLLPDELKRTATITLPATKPGVSYRLVVREYENFATGSLIGDGGVTERQVYFDIVEM